MGIKVTKAEGIHALAKLQVSHLFPMSSAKRNPFISLTALLAILMASLVWQSFFTLSICGLSLKGLLSYIIISVGCLLSFSLYFPSTLIGVCIVVLVEG